MLLCEILCEMMLVFSFLLMIGLCCVHYVSEYFAYKDFNDFAIRTGDCRCVYNVSPKDIVRILDKHAKDIYISGVNSIKFYCYANDMKLLYRFNDKEVILRGTRCVFSSFRDYLKYKKILSLYKQSIYNGVIYKRYSEEED